MALYAGSRPGPHQILDSTLQHDVEIKIVPSDNKLAWENTQL